MLCPFCKETLSDDVTKCKFCGSWVRTTSASTNLIKPKSKFKKRLPFIFLLGILGIGLFLATQFDFETMGFNFLKPSMPSMESVKNSYLENVFGLNKTIAAGMEELSSYPVEWKSFYITEDSPYKKTHYVVESNFQFKESRQRITLQFLVDKKTKEFYINCALVDDIRVPVNAALSTLAFTQLKSGIIETIKNSYIEQLFGTGNTIEASLKKLATNKNVTWDASEIQEPEHYRYSHCLVEASFKIKNDNMVVQFLIARDKSHKEICSGKINKKRISTEQIMNLLALSSMMTALDDEAKERASQEQKTEQEKSNTETESNTEN